MSNLKNRKKFTKENAAEMGARGGLAKRGSKHISTHVKEMLEDSTFVQKLKTKDGKIITKKEEPLPAIIRALIAKARSGDIQAAKLLFETGWGKNMSVDLTNSDGSLSLAEAIAGKTRKLKVDTDKL